MMFPPLPIISIPALVPLGPYATAIWLVGILLLWATRYTHQLGARLGRGYYFASAIVRPAGIVLIAVGWLAVYADDNLSYRVWFPRSNTLDVLLWFAIALFAALGGWSFIVLGLRRSFLYRRTDDPLITGGPYSLVRHPQFLSAIGVVFFTIALYGNWDFVDPIANWALFTLSLWVLAIVEERELLAHFGDTYRAYAQRVPRLFPN